MKKLFVFVSDGGDGSYNTQYTFNEAWVNKTQDAHDNDEYEYPNLGVDGDGFHYDTLTVPDECTLESLGIHYDCVVAEMRINKMKRHIAWPCIGEFRNVVKNVQHQSQYVGQDDNGEPIFNRLAKSPKLKFQGTCKIHGTNASVVLGGDGEMWVQSRPNIITPEYDNAGFAMFVERNKDEFTNLLNRANIECGYTTEDLVIFGEWCGGNIQKGVAVCELPKMFVIFGIAIAHDVETKYKTYFTREEVQNVCRSLSWPEGTTPTESNIYSIYDFPTFEIEIDFENPHESVQILNKLAELVGDECPVGKAFGISGIGEGVVWRCVEDGYEDSGYFFKVKDERHSNSKVKVLANVDVERINNIKELAERLANNGRLEQMHQTVFNTLNGGETDISKTGEFIKAVMHDIAKEDISLIAENGFTFKEISSPVSKICRDYLMANLQF